MIASYYSLGGSVSSVDLWEGVEMGRRGNGKNRGADQTYAFWNMDPIDCQTTRFGYSRRVDDDGLIDAQYLLQASAKIDHVLRGFNGNVLLLWACLTNLLGEPLTDRLVLRKEVE